MNTSQRSGFTLIELLTVIAIIAILASMLMVAGPRLIEKSKLAKLDGVFRELRTAATEYYTSSNSYPPAYGYIPWDLYKNKKSEYDDSALMINPSLDQGHYFLRPFMSMIGRYGEDGLYDLFSSSYDTNHDNELDLLEYGATATKDQATGNYTGWPTTLYRGNFHALPLEEQDRLTAAKPRPLIYVSVNLAQFKKAREYWVKNGFYLAEQWDPTAPLLSGIKFPPSTYDAFALISVGPGNNTYGVVAKPLGTEDPRFVYFITALRTFFLATRDLNDDGLKDFDYRARAGQGEAKYTAEHPYEKPVKGNNTGKAGDNDLPDPANMHGYGPVLFSFPEKI